MKKWQKRKLRSELLALLVVVIGVILVVTHIFDITPWLAIVGCFIAFAGVGALLDVRNKNYRKPKRVHK